jgi:multiple sugar transport system substrate-binding protein
MNRKGILLLTLVLLFGLQIFRTYATGKDEQPVTIRLCTYFSDNRFAPLEKILNQYMADKPNVKVVVERVAYSGHYAKKLAETASGTLPDIWEFVPGYGAYWLEKGLLLDISRYVANDPLNKLSDFDQAMLGYFKRGNKLYGLPYDINGGALYYNKELFDKAGLAYPNEKWTYDDFYNALKTGVEKLSTVDKDGKKKKVWGMSTPVQTDWVGVGFFDAWDAPIVTSKGTIGTDNPLMLKMLKYWMRMLDEGIVPIPEPNNPQNVFTQGITLFTNGESMTHVTYAGFINTFLNAGMKVGVAPMPAGPSGKHGTKLGGSWVISETTKNPREAYDVFSLICSEQSMAKYTMGLPSRPALNAMINPGLQQVAEAIKSYGWTVAVNGCQQIWTLKDKLLEQMWLRKLTPEEVVKQLGTEGSEILKQAKNN